MKTKRNRKGVVLFCFVMLIAVFTGAKQVWAASEYQEMFTIAGSLTHRVCGEKDQEGGFCSHPVWGGQVIKRGDYYFKGKITVPGDGDVCVDKIYISDKKNSGFQLTPLAATAYDVPYTNGKEAYYIQRSARSDERALYRYVFRTRKKEKLKELSVSDAYIVTIYGGNIYLKGYDSETDKWKMDVYNTRKKTLSALKDNVIIERRSGKYAISYDTSENDVSPLGTLTLWRITESGLKKVKTIENVAGYAVGFIGDELYYAVYKDKSKREVTICKSKQNGAGQKKLAGIKAPKKNERVDILEIGPDNCIVESADSGTMYLWTYTYATKKMTRY